MSATRRGSGSAAAILTLLVAFTAAMSSPDPAPPRPAPDVAGQGCTGTDPAWSPDGAWLAFVAWCDGQAELYRMRPDGSERTRLTESPGEEHTPAWSPDGTRIAYTYRAEGEDSEIWIVAPDGSDPRPVTEDGFSEVGPTWSPDGTRLAYESRRDGNGDVFVLDLETGEELRLTSDAANDVAPAWSPDGRTIAFQSDREGHYGIWGADPDGSATRPLYTPAAHVTTPSWSPDGRKLVAAHHGDGRGELYRVRLEDGNATRLTDNDRTDFAPKWSPDGAAVAFLVREGEAWNVFVMELEGGGERRLTGGGGPAPTPCNPNVLFVGNSYTYYNNLPAMTAALLGERARVSRVTAPGARLLDHWRAGTALDSIRAGGWSHVVLQAQSLLGGIRINGEPTVAPPDSLRKYVALFDERIRGSGGRTVLLQTWARAGSPEDQRALDHAYFSVARELTLEVVPVGLAWEGVREEHPGLELHAPDGSHPSPTGTLLAALVLREALCGPGPASVPTRVEVDSIDARGLPEPGSRSVIRVTDELAEALGRAARAAVSRLAEAGGVLQVPAVAPPEWPRVPEPDPGSTLAGPWTGSFSLNVPAELALELRPAGGGAFTASGSLTLGSGSYDFDDLPGPVADGVLTLPIPFAGGGILELRAVARGNGIAGVAEMRFHDRLIAVAEVRMERADGPAEPTRPF